MSEEENSNTSGDVEAVKEETNKVDSAMGQDTNNSEELNSVKAAMTAMEDRLQQQSALIGKLSNSLKKEEKAEPVAPSGDEAKGEVAQFNEMKQQLEDFQTRMKKQEKAAKLSSIELALVEAGATPTLAKNQAEFFAFKLNERIVTSDDDAGNISIQIADTDGSNVSVNDWAKALIQSDNGAYLRAGKTGPSVNNGGTPREDKGKVKLSSLEFSQGIAQAVKGGEDAVKQFRATHSMKE